MHHVTSDETKEADYHSQTTDLDENSQYPNAMAKHGFPMGMPALIPSDVSSQELIDMSFRIEDRPVCVYFAEIRITHMETDHHIGLVSHVDEDGTRQWSDQQAIGKVHIMHNTTLKQLVDLCGMRFDFIQGIAFSHGLNNTICSVMPQLYEARNQMKALQNPAQEVLKLLMNSSYGKLIQRPIDTGLEYFSTAKIPVDKYVNKHRFNLEHLTSIGTDKGGHVMYQAKLRKSINEHESYPHLGAQVLAVAKLGMNELVDILEENDMKCYITDTDSLQCDKHALPVLSKEFMKRTGVQLLGGELGQFKVDYDIPRDGDPEGEVFACESYFLGKKAYISKIQYTKLSGEIGHFEHIRLKGVGSKIVLATGNAMDIYKRMYNREEIAFDLLSTGAAGLVTSDSFVVSQRKKFIRKVSF
jgi:hypothetical protein